MDAVSFIAAPFLWGIHHRNVGELRLNSRANPSGFHDPNKIFRALEQRENSTKLQFFSTTTSPTKHWDKDLMPVQASSQLDKPAPDKNWPRSVKLAVASTIFF